MVLLWVSAIVYLEHMALSLGLRGPRGPQNDNVHLKPQYLAFLASNLLFMVVLGCALDMVLLWVFVITYEELVPLSLGLGVPGGP